VVDVVSDEEGRTEMVDGAALAAVRPKRKFVCTHACTHGRARETQADAHERM